MSKGFTDWTDLGIFPLQDVEENVPIGMRMSMVAGRVSKRPDAGEGGSSELTEYAREGGLGTLGDIHPWFFWQTTEREKRDMGSWSMAWGVMVTDSASTRYGGAAGVQPLTRNGSSMVNDSRYKVIQPAWQSALPWQPEGMLGMLMPSTDETNPSSVMLNGDRRLVAAGASGPGAAGTTIVDMQPDGVLCMDGSTNPGQGGRHARLHGLVRVVALGQGSVMGSPDLNGIAINYGTSQQDGIVGYGMVFGPGVSGGGGGPTTGQTGPTSPITQGGNSNPSSSGPGGPPTPDRPSNGDFASAGGGNFNASGPEGPNAGAETSVADFGSFQATPRPGHAIGFMSAVASGPIAFGCSRHTVGFDKDGHRMTSAHITSGAYFYDSGERDGPLMFEGRFPDNVDEHAIPSLVHLSWDEKQKHDFVGGERTGKWRWWTTVPYVESEGGEDDDDESTTPESPSTPSVPNSPGGPYGPATPGAGGGPAGPTAPNAPSSPGAPTAPITPRPPRNAPPVPYVPNPYFPKPRSPITPGADWTDRFQPKPPKVPGTPRKPLSPVTPGGKPGGTPPIPYTPNQSPDAKYANAPGDTVFSGRGTRYPISDRELDYENNSAISQRRGPSGVVGQVGGSAQGRDVGLYSIFHPFNTGFAAISFRPQLWIKGAPNFEHNPTLGARAYKTEERTRPSVLTIRAWGAQSESGDWDYSTPPSASRARGGLVSGGLLLSPSEFEMEDYLGINSSADTDNPTVSTYVTFAPKVAAAFGKPTVGGLPSASSKLVHQDTAGGALLVSEIDANGDTIDILKMSVVSSQGYLDIDGTGALKVPVGTTAQRPTAITGMTRFNTSLGDLEYYDGSAWRSAYPSDDSDKMAFIDITQPVNLDDVESDTATNNAKISADMTGIGGATYSTLQDMHNLTNSAGVLTGGDITDDGDGTITVSAGTCFIRATDDNTADLLFADFPANSGASLDLTGNPGGNPIYINYNSGTLQTERSVGGGSDKNTFIYLGSVYRDGTTLYITQTRRDTVLTHTVKMLERIKDVEPFALVSGCVLSEVGTRNIAATVGGWWDGLVETSTAGVNTSTVGTFESYYLDGVTSWSAGSTETQINNIEYSRGTPSAGTLSSGAYGVRWLYVDVEGNYHSLLGYAKGDFEEAQEETPPLPNTLGVPLFFHNGYARLIGKIIIEQGASTFHSIEQPFGDPFAKPLPSAAVTTAMVQDDAITTAKIVDDAVTTAKLTDGAVTTVKIEAEAVDNDRLAQMPAETLKGNSLGVTGTAGNLSVSQTQTLLDYDPKLQSKAFCHFTTVAPPVDNGFNIASVVRNGVGEYRITFTTAMTTTTYSVAPCIFDTAGTIALFTVVSQTTGYLDIETKNGAGTLSDASEAVSLTIHEYT